MSAQKPERDGAPEQNSAAQQGPGLRSDEPRAPSSGAAQGDKPASASLPGAPQGPTVPVPSLPKGGGAIRGVDEKFSANPVTGTGSSSIPLPLSPGRAGTSPELALRYDSGAGNGPFGASWQLSIPRITRRTDKRLPTYEDFRESDLFLLSGAEDLVPARSADGSQPDAYETATERVARYRPRVEGTFARIERHWVKADGNVYWTATTPENLTSIYGRSASARIADSLHPERIFSWLLEETRDDKGNVVTYEYKPEDLAGTSRAEAPEVHRHKGWSPVVNRYLKRIRYGNTIPGDASATGMLFEIVFDYGEHDSTIPTPLEVTPWLRRQDPFSTYRSGFEIRTYRLCRRVLVFHHMAELGPSPCLVRSLDLTYAENPVLSRLTSATTAGYLRDPATQTYTRKAFPATTFTYSDPVIRTEVKDLDLESLHDLLPGGITAPGRRWVDLDGEALPGFLLDDGEALYYKRNLGHGHLSPARALSSRPGAGATQLADIDGDGKKEMVVFDRPVAGYFDRTEDGWAPFRPFMSQPNVDWKDPNLRLIDLNGDGQTSHPHRRPGHVHVVSIAG